MHKILILIAAILTISGCATVQQPMSAPSKGGVAGDCTVEVIHNGDITSSKITCK